MQKCQPVVPASFAFGDSGTYISHKQATMSSLVGLKDIRYRNRCISHLAKLTKIDYEEDASATFLLCLWSASANVAQMILLAHQNKLKQV